MRNALKERDFLVSDGGMGTTLMEWGLKPGELPDVWNIDHPEVVEEVHRQFIEAGADIIQTNTFSANLERFRLSGFGEYVFDAANKAAVNIAHKAVGGKSVFVAGTVGPTGSYLRPFGDLTPEEMREIYSEQIEILADNGVDCILIETQISLGEAKIALSVAKESTLPVVVSMTFNLNYGTNIMGERLIDVVEALELAGADIIGINCIHPDYVREYLRQMRESRPEGRFLAQPNAGSPHLFREKTEYDINPEKMAGFAEEYHKLGVKIIGGCCGVTPEHIKSISQKLRGQPCY